MDGWYLKENTHTGPHSTYSKAPLLIDRTHLAVSQHVCITYPLLSSADKRSPTEGGRSTCSWKCCSTVCRTFPWWLNCWLWLLGHQLFPVGVQTITFTGNCDDHTWRRRENRSWPACLGILIPVCWILLFFFFIGWKMSWLQDVSLLHFCHREVWLGLFHPTQLLRDVSGYTAPAEWIGSCQCDLIKKAPFHISLCTRLYNLYCFSPLPLPAHTCNSSSFCLCIIITCNCTPVSRALGSAPWSLQLIRSWLKPNDSSTTLLNSITDLAWFTRSPVIRAQRFFKIL